MRSAGVLALLTALEEGVSVGSGDSLIFHPTHHAIPLPSSSPVIPLGYLRYIQLILGGFTVVYLLCVWVGGAHVRSEVDFLQLALFSHHVDLGD